MTFLAALTACLTLKCILFCVVAGIVLGIIVSALRDTVGMASMVGHIIIGIVFSYLGLVIVLARWGFALFSLPAIAGGLLVALFGLFIVGSALS